MDHGIESKTAPSCGHCAPSRRGLLKSVLALALASLWGGRRLRAQDVRVSRPQKQDVLVYAFGDQAGQPVALESLRPGANPVLAFPMDPATQQVRDGSRLNQVMLLRLDPGELSEQTRKYSAEGVVAYSAVCTHLGCPPTGWFPDQRVLKCWCHDSMFDPKDYGKVVGGPAPRRLAQLPVAVSGGLLTVAGEFTGRVGFTPG
jgi:Rieske Fe-S protein